MPVRYLSDPELDRLSSWQGEIAEQDAVTFFTLTGDDLGWVRGFNRDENRLGVAVQLAPQLPEPFAELGRQATGGRAGEGGCLFARHGIHHTFLSSVPTTPRPNATAPASST